MKKTVFILLTLLVFISCKEKDQCGNDIDISGIYENKFEEGATNYLIIKNDGTFEQKYKKGDTIKINKGKWEYFNTRKHCVIRFDTLKQLHNVPYRETLENTAPHFRRNKILFYEDLPFEYDFIKTNKKIE